MNYYVFGGANIDITIKLNNGKMDRKSNRSIIKVTHGGVGRNIARSIANYRKCTFVSVFNNDPYMLDLRMNLLDHGVNLKHSKIMEELDSYYVNVITNKGILFGASDMKLINELSIDDVKPVVEQITEDDIVVCDANLNVETIDYILTYSKGYKIIDVVSETKLNNVSKLLSRFDLIKCNELESKHIIFYKDYIITGGNSVKIKINDTFLSCTHNRLEPVSTNGCGDTFVGTFISNLDLGIKEAIVLSIKSGMACSQCYESVPTLEQINAISDDIVKIEWEK